MKNTTGMKIFMIALLILINLCLYNQVKLYKRVYALELIVDRQSEVLSSILVPRSEEEMLIRTLNNLDSKVLDYRGVQRNFSKIDLAEG